MEAQPHEPRWERKADERPAALYNAALQAFTEKGFRATRLEDVAALAGVSKGTIYHYFKNKDDLLIQALESKMQDRADEITLLLSNFEGSFEEKITLIIRNVWHRFLQNDWGRLQLLLLGEIAQEFPSFFEHWSKNGPQKISALLEKVLSDGIAAGKFRPDVDAGATARIMISGLVHQALTRVHLGQERHDPCSRERILNSTLDIFLHGLRRRISVHEATNSFP